MYFYLQSFPRRNRLCLCASPSRFVDPMIPFLFNRLLFALVRFSLHSFFFPCLLVDVLEHHWMLRHGSCVPMCERTRAHIENHCEHKQLRRRTNQMQNAIANWNEYELPHAFAHDRLFYIDFIVALHFIVVTSLLVANTFGVTKTSRKANEQIYKTFELCLSIGLHMKCLCSQLHRIQFCDQFTIWKMADTKKKPTLSYRSMCDNNYILSFNFR